jgi:hypothetical protein
MDNNKYRRNCEKSVPKIAFLTRLGAWGSVREKRSTVNKLIKKNIKYITKIITMTRGGGARCLAQN